MKLNFSINLTLGCEYKNIKDINLIFNNYDKKNTTWNKVKKS